MTSDQGFKIEYIEFKNLDATVQKLIEESVKSREMAYCPYSKFKVGACVLTDKGTMYGGCNIENACHAPGLCAERTAIAKAVSSGERDFRAIAVSALGAGGELVSPCGVCRQVIAEFSRDRDVPVYLSLPDLTKVAKTSIRQLLPMCFYSQTH